MIQGPEWSIKGRPVWSGYREWEGEGLRELNLQREEVMGVSRDGACV